MKTNHRFLLMATFALWFGGFTFYTAFVVPVGNEVLGSSRIQGFVTQQVTHSINLVNTFAMAMFVVEWFVERRNRSRRKNLILGGTIAAIFAFWLVLIYVHQILDGHITVDEADVFDSVVNEPETFYQIHRVYLWASTFQWILSWGWLLMTIHDWTKASRPLLNET